MPRATSPFVLENFDEDPPYLDQDDVTFARARIAKRFSGDLVGTSRVEMLSARVAGQPAGYVALEHVTGSLEGKHGSFVIAHLGTMSGSGHFAKWPIVPGSGSGDLEGISGETQIEIDPDGAHTLYIDYESDSSRQ